jgi:N-acyl amino acid synthase of PEP-CTERM/exosortase system
MTEVLTISASLLLFSPFPRIRTSSFRNSPWDSRERIGVDFFFSSSCVANFLHQWHGYAISLSPELVKLSNQFPIGIIMSAQHFEAERKKGKAKFVFPGSLRLHTQHLKKDKNSPDNEEVFKLRYQVYCHEAHFLDPEGYPAGVEMDRYDSTSEHFFARAVNKENTMVGTVRLILWSKEHSFPTAEHFPPLLKVLARLQFPLESTAEISRLCVSKLFRKRATDGLLGVEGYSEGGDPRRKYQQIILELFKSMYRVSTDELGITHLIATFEEGLFRLLSRYGFKLEIITPEVINYYGKVKIYGAPIQCLEDDLKATNSELYDYFRQDII